MGAFDSAWSLLKNFDEKRGPIRVDPDGIDGPTTQEELDAPPPRRKPQMDDDPFRMKQPDMSAQIEQMLAEIQRREGRRNPDFHHQDYDSDFYRNKYDRENPQDNQLLNTTRPQMNDRMEALRAEMERRARKRGSPVEGDSPLDPSTEEYERAFDKKHADMQSFGAPEGMTNEEYGIIDQPDSKYTKELQGQALQDYIKQRFG
jgi:hypothetical protein|tara:strand:- start:7902 stop:8510 length:609 start_codon:yes stop_codon:yes gene_type:complete